MKNLISAISLLSIMLLSESCYYDNKEDLYQYLQTETCVITDVSYSNDVLNIIATHCLSCHNNNDQQGGINLEGYNNVKASANNGSLYGSIIHDPGFVLMPPSGVKIPQCDIESIKFWIDNGALDN